MCLPLALHGCLNIFSVVFYEIMLGHVQFNGKNLDVVDFNRWVVVIVAATSAVICAACAPHEEKYEKIGKLWGIFV